MLNPDITLITPDYPPVTGGVARYLSNLVAASAGRIEVISDTRKIFRSVWPRWWPAVKSIKSIKSKVLVSHVLPLGTAAWIAKIVGGPEYGVLFHGTDIRLVQGLWKKWLVKRICCSAKVLFCNSEHTKGELQQLIASMQIVVVTPGVEQRDVILKCDARRSLDLAEDTKIVLSVARLTPRKGIDASLRALSRIQSKRDVQYVVIGDGADRERLENIATESRTRVRWIPKATDREKWLWLSAADVFLLPGRDDGNDVEGFGIAYLEAALAGVPAVAGKSGGATEAVRHERTGLVVNPKSIDEIEEGVERLLNDEVLRTRLGQEARARALADFHWKDRWDRVAKAFGIEPS